VKYLYLAASLPTLSWGAPPPYRVQDFRFRTEGVLSDADQAELERVLDGPPEHGTSSAARTGFDLDSQLRNAAANIRATRHGVAPRSAPENPRSASPFAVRQVTEAYAKSNPLERERVLDQTRWNALDELAGGAPFGFAAVLAHGLKLQLLERWTRVEATSGHAALERHLDILQPPLGTESA